MTDGDASGVVVPQDREGGRMLGAGFFVLSLVVGVYVANSDLVVFRILGWLFPVVGALVAYRYWTTRGCTVFLEGLLDTDGLVADRRSPDGSVEPSVYTYNQALLVGLLADLGRVDDAVALAVRVQAAFDEERLWSHPPAFNAIFVRELLRLDGGRPEAGLRAWCSAYLTRAWTEARGPATGLFTGGGIGRYDSGVVLDHAALTGATAELARSST